MNTPHTGPRPIVYVSSLPLKRYITLAKTTTKRADLAQLVERVAFNHVVVGSNPTVGAFINLLYEFRTG